MKLLHTKTMDARQANHTPPELIEAFKLLDGTIFFDTNALISFALALRCSEARAQQCR